MQRHLGTRDSHLRVPRPTAGRYFIGLDLGQSQDYTAVSVLAETLDDGAPKPKYQVGHLERFPLGTPYPDIVRAIVSLTERPELHGDWQLVVDAKGVGRPVVDLLREGFGGFAHDLSGEWVEKPVAGHEVHGLDIPHPRTPTGVERVGHAAH